MDDIRRGRLQKCIYCVTITITIAKTFKSVAVPMVHNACTQLCLIEMGITITIYLRSIPLGWDDKPTIKKELEFD